LPTAVPSDGDLNALAAQVLDRLHAQRGLPHTPIHPASWLDGLSLDLSDLLLAVIVIAIVAGAGLALARMRRDPPGWHPDAADAVGAAQEEASHLAAAERLAEAGQLTDALHELLLQALADIRRHRRGRLEASLTSREILAAARLAPEANQALAYIIHSVEWTYFGLRPASRATWQECRARLVDMAHALDSAP